METGQKDGDEQAARIHQQWIGHLAKWAKAELCRRGCTCGRTEK